MDSDRGRVGFLALVPPAWVVRKEATTRVDLELVIAVDVSTSMSDQEQRMQREGYVGALLSPEVMRAIRSGRRGRIALAYLEWARPEYQRVIVPWTVIEDPTDAAGAAKLIRGQPMLPQGGTSISTALLSAARLLLNSGLESDRQVVDVSGDGPNNAGPTVESARDALIARGVTINGLAISIPVGEPYDMIESFPLNYVISYYKLRDWRTACVCSRCRPRRGLRKGHPQEIRGGDRGSAAALDRRCGAGRWRQRFV